MLGIWKDIFLCVWLHASLRMSPPLKKKKNPICPPLWVFSVISEEEQTHVEESVPFMASPGSVFLVSLSCKWWMSDCTNVCSCQSAVVRFPPLSALTYHHTHTHTANIQAAGASRDQCDGSAGAETYNYLLWLYNLLIISFAASNNHLFSEML